METRRPSLRSAGNIARDGKRAVIEGLDFESAEGSVPDEGRSTVDGIVYPADGGGPISKKISSGRTAVTAAMRTSAPFFSSRRENGIARQEDGTALRSRIAHDVARRTEQVVLAERSADVDALRRQKGVGHAAADDQRVDIGDEIGKELELG